MKNSLLKNSLFAVALWVTGGFGGELFASDFPSMPSIDSPSMPSLSSPSSGPATPWRGGAPYIPSQASPAQQQSAEPADDLHDVHELGADRVGLALLHERAHEHERLGREVDGEQGRYQEPERIHHIGEWRIHPDRRDESGHER